MNRRQFVSTAGATVLGAVLGGCGSTGRFSSLSTGGSTNRVKILDEMMYKSGTSIGIRGTIQNVSDSELSYIEVQAAFLNDEGPRIGTATDTTHDFSSGEKWEFDATYTGNSRTKIDDYKLEVIEAY